MADESIPLDKSRYAADWSRSEIIWRNVAFFSALHAAAVYACFVVGQVHTYTLVWELVYAGCGSLGVTAGVHRLWSHRSYKAKFPLRVALAVAFSMNYQNSIADWSRDHRVHHKFSETDADPHNARRGFLFSHVGWLLIRKHPDVGEKSRAIDVSDLAADPVVVFQHRHRTIIMLFATILIPAVVPVVAWGEDWRLSALMVALRYCLILNFTWSVNSFAHMWGSRPYDRRINPAENLLVSLVAIGEGFHNYHHVFPQDYACSEFGIRLNPTTAFINLMAWLGLAYDLHTTSPTTVAARKLRTGAH